MLFQEGIFLIKSKLKNPLPGEEAQHILAPASRKTTHELLKERPSHRLSSVLMLLFPDENQILLTLFIERPVNNSIHSGQLAFPGGKVEESDRNMEHTALRETEEEIGVTMEKIEVIGILSPMFIPASNFLVYPHIGVINETPQFIPSPDEVKSIITFPVETLLKLNPVSKTFKTLYGNLNAPAFEIYHHYLWGATAMMVSEFREMVGH